jgi:hypothetical protein
MTTRRGFLRTVTAAAAGASLAGWRRRGQSEPAPADAGDLSQFVKPPIGTGGQGHTYPGAQVPLNRGAAMKRE